MVNEGFLSSHVGAEAALRAGAGCRELSIASYDFLHQNSSESGQQKKHG